ncbi:MAG: DUF1573 domain-containing protein [Chitinophagales bacterium]|nr:DUF1573 domain-containing protein [Chitinophagales bacterium]
MAQTTGVAVEPPVSKISFTTTEHDFGAQPQGTPVSYEFNFTNVGVTPIQLQSVKPSCGCTSPEWTNDTVLPGKNGVIKITYNMAREGSFNKPVTVTTTDGETVMLYIKGEAISSEAPNPAEEIKPSLVAPPKQPE